MGLIFANSKSLGTMESVRNLNGHSHNSQIWFLCDFQVSNDFCNQKYQSLRSFIKVVFRVNTA